MDNAASLRAFVRGRAAAADGQMDAAALAYATALATDSGDPLLQRRAFGLALAAGDHKLSSDLALKLEKAGQATGESELLLFADAVQNRDWRRANALQALLAKEKVYQFLAPLMADWVRIGQGGDPYKDPEPTRLSPIERAYADEQRAYVLNAMGRLQTALDAYAPQANDPSGRGMRPKLAAAAMLQKARRKDDALKMLAGDQEPLVAARALIEQGKPLPTAVDTPATGIAELLARFAADLSRQEVPELPLLLARISTFLAPRNAESWIIVAQVLWAGEKPAAALDALHNIPADDPFSSQARMQQAGLLISMGRKDEGQALLQQATDAPDASAASWARLADVQSDNGRNREAVASYDRAIALAKPNGEPPLWTLYMLRGGVLEKLNDWPASEAGLRKAVELAPSEPVALNYLGYAMLDRGVKLDEATALIEKASAIQPDNAAITDSLGWTYYRRGDYAKAVTTLERAAAGEQTEATIHEHLGDAYWKVGRRIEARFAWRAALADSEDTAEQARLKGKIDLGPDVAATARP